MLWLRIRPTCNKLAFSCGAMPPDCATVEAWDQSLDNSRSVRLVGNKLTPISLACTVLRQPPTCHTVFHLNTRRPIYCLTIRLFCWHGVSIVYEQSLPRLRSTVRSRWWCWRAEPTEYVTLDEKWGFKVEVLKGSRSSERRRRKQY